MSSGKTKDASKSTQPALPTYKRRPGPEQVALHVEINVPGRWFTGLNAQERRAFYRVTADDWEEKHVWEPQRSGRSAKVGEAMHFLCGEDAGEDALHSGYWMKKEEWDRYRNDTYKDTKEAETPFLPMSEVVIVAPKPAPQPTEAKKPLEYSHFNFLRSGTHVQNEGAADAKTVPCEWWECKNKAIGRCKGHEDLIPQFNSTHKRLWYLCLCLVRVAPQCPRYGSCLVCGCPLSFLILLYCLCLRP